MKDNRAEEIHPLARIAADKANKELGDVPGLLSNDAGTKILNKYEESEVNRDNSFKDPMTGLLNRRGLLEEYNLEEETRNRLSSNFGPNVFIALDLIGLKRLNNELTSKGADKVIKDAASTLQQQIRKTDLAGRWGGDEFLLILFGVNQDTATNTIQKILDNLPEHVNYNIGYKLVTPDNDPRSQMDQIMSQMDNIKHMGGVDESGRAVGNGVVVNIDSI